MFLSISLQSLFLGCFQSSSEDLFRIFSRICYRISSRNFFQSFACDLKKNPSRVSKRVIPGMLLEHLRGFLQEFFKNLLQDSSRDQFRFLVEFIARNFLKILSGFLLKLHRRLPSEILLRFPLEDSFQCCSWGWDVFSRSVLHFL